ncbi:MAG: Rne/Rng family ribonuclease [Rothia sp. (in: high G+C Gram-positive bacteria)]|uniref:Rne/Rng family ribonuclease n=1 Tax=Rothia sp. (in: high G+C Gram-positive bacteria) TaxID=1885016 RepID=UPI0026DFF1BD|nr:Rne/Rng family ribonuclease [Rothia sp. (in: high G+C Gram-positive bacteria)]MDO5750898.1 Rne/Rng family ribonuclease [Rothia sp. (in: high G+C Gram-positive bacteria)]
MAEETNANNPGLNVDVLADMLSLASKNNRPDTLEALSKQARELPEEASEELKTRLRPAAPARRKVVRPKVVKEKTPEPPLEEAIASGLSALKAKKAIHAPAPKKAPAQLDDVAPELDQLMETGLQAAAAAPVEEPVVEIAEQEPVSEVLARVEAAVQVPAEAPVEEAAESAAEESAVDAADAQAVAAEAEVQAELAEAAAEAPVAEAPAAPAAEATAPAEAAEEAQTVVESASEESTEIIIDLEALSDEESEQTEEEEPAEPVKTLRDIQAEKLAEMRAQVGMGSMPLFYSPNLTELSAAATIEREQFKAARLEAARKERMERRREEVAAEAEVTSHRRRRRRRGTEDLEIEGTEDNVETVTKVRAPRISDSHGSNTVTGVRGSTRLEAKRVRRRESRSLGRRRHIVTEAEFLARRESVDRQMLVRQKDDRVQIGVLEDGVLAEHFVSKTQQDSLIGNVYLGKVQNVLPSMEAAFVDIGRGRNAVLYAGEVNWDVSGLDGAPRKIENALKAGDSVLVQVTKDPIGHKGARLTSQVSLPGRYLVYVPGGSMTGISRKLPDTERTRLKKILKDKLPDGAGVIVRTAAEGASEEELANDINRLRAQWEDIQEKANSRKVLAPEMLYQEPDLMIKTVRDVFNEDFTTMTVQGDQAWDSIQAYVTYVAPDLVARLQRWDGEDDLFDHFRVNEQLAKALDRKVYLPSGGSLVIDRTEAMTVVDVNTGKFTGSGGNLEETVTKNNLEAAEEIVRQLRLRDIGGIIVIDFIDMVLESNRELVLRRLIECLGRDRTKHQVAEVTSLGLVQMTRKRLGTGLLEVFSEPCEECGGRGLIVHDAPLSGRSSGASDFIHRHDRTERKRARNAAVRPAETEQVDEQSSQRAHAMADIAAASTRTEESEAAEQSRKKRKRRKRTRRAEVEAAAVVESVESAHNSEDPALDAPEAAIDPHWSGEQGDFEAGQFDHVDPQADPRFTRGSALGDVIAAGEAKARASQKAGRIARSEDGGFRSNRRNERREDSRPQRDERVARTEGKGIREQKRADLRVEDVHELPRKRRTRRSEEQGSARSESRGERSHSAPRVSGVIGGAPRVSGVIGAPAPVAEVESVEKTAAPAASVATVETVAPVARKRRVRRAASSAGIGSGVVAADVQASAQGSVVASASMADVVAPNLSETPTLLGTGVAAADIKRVGKD